MDFDEQLELGELLLTERKCRVCKKIKSLTEDFYLTRRNRTLLSAYSYECKECTKKRVKSKKVTNTWQYPDW